ncbi:diaminopimelate decarboxylase [Tistrella bauzanensis]|jgi:diaminopimelate decarboxylase|uniref:Diaminopimelate decarboxylase n=1 Tax=Tistrella arctica TaxID=3133430 RepID=A0ABU9YFW3_9PROT
MDHFEYRAGRLHAEDVPLERIAAEVGTPVYVYSRATLTRHARVFRDALAGRIAPHGRAPLICYAVKANGNQAVLRILAAEGYGADVVSAGEMKRALAAGIPAEKIVFSGVAKTDGEIRAALEAGILQFNVESDAELDAIDRVAGAMGQIAKVSLRINPDIDAGTHAKITTGKADNKFGIAWDRAPDVYAHASRLAHIEATGIDLHIGSQLSKLEPFEAAFTRTVGLVRSLRAAGHPIRHLDLGGGLGIPYDDETPPAPEAYADMVARVTGDLDLQLIFEPGRVIVGNAGLMMSRVVYVKDTATRRFLILDAGMNDLMRPALYDAYHEVVAVSEPAAGAPRTPVEIVGPVCESTDVFARDRLMPPLDAGDLVAFRSAGAYGATMSNTYNARELVPEVLVDGDRYAVIRPRQSIEDLIAMDRVPDWL